MSESDVNEKNYGYKEYEQMQLSEDDTMEVSAEILIMLFLLMLSIMGGHFLKKRNHKFLQESGLTTLIGLIAGLILKSMDIDEYMTKLSNHFVRLFMILLLPPIIFESGYNMQKQPFLQNIGTIMMYALMGTFISFLSSSGLFYGFGLTPLQPYLTLQESFAFGSLISATDPVAVLAIFKELNADITLYTIIFGESIFNDAIAIVMYDTVAETNFNSDLDYTTVILQSVAQFFVVLIGSVLIGALAALTIAFILKRQASYSKEDGQEMRDQKRLLHSSFASGREQIEYKQNVNSEISMMVLCPWVSYLIAEGLKLSGIVSIIVNGIFLSYYAEPNISDQSKKVLKIGYQSIAYAAETLVFIFLGLGIFAFNHPYEQMGPIMIFTTLFIVNFTRFLNILIVTFFVNKSRSDDTRIQFKFQFVMWLSGLRGAMAYALAMKCSQEFPMGPVILIDTLLFSLFTILGIATIMNPILHKCDVQIKEGEPVQQVQQKSNENKKKCCQKFKRRLKVFDLQYFSPLFIKNQKDIDRRNNEMQQNELEDEWQQNKQNRLDELELDENEIIEEKKKDGIQID